MRIPSTIDVPAVRAATPGCAHVIHFNNAGASLPPKVVTDAVLAYTAREALIGGACARSSPGFRACRCVTRDEPGAPS